MPRGVEVEEREDGDIQVRAPYDEDWRQRAKELGGKWDPEERVWYFPSHRYDLQDIEKEARDFFPSAFR